MNSIEVITLIQKEMKNQGISMREMAKRVGVSNSNVAHWLNGGGITLKNADKALKALGISATIGTMTRENKGGKQWQEE